ELIEPAVLRLRLPVELDDHRVRAHPGQAPRSGGSRRLGPGRGRGRGTVVGRRRRRGPVVPTRRRHQGEGHDAGDEAPSPCPSHLFSVLPCCPAGAGFLPCQIPHPGPSLAHDGSQAPTTRCPRSPKPQNTTRPSRHATKTVATSSADWRREAYRSKSRPRPGVPRPKKKSPTMAPITDRPAAVRSPVKIPGRAAGTWSLNVRVHRLAPWRVNSSCRPRSALRRPVSELM